MDQAQLDNKLADLHLGGVRFFNQVGSTNDEAARWIEQGAPDLALVIADEQTQGRGRIGRTWHTNPGSALAFSLILYPHNHTGYMMSRMTALGALGVTGALNEHYALNAQIKWPNDVLIGRRKVAGVLAEAQWTGDQVAALILGVGINVSALAVDEAIRKETELRFPATSLQEALNQPVDRVVVLHQVLEKILYWRTRMASPGFLQAWEATLAFRGEWVQVTAGESRGKDGLPSDLETLAPALQKGQIVGLETDGSLKLRKQSGEVVAVRVGEVRLLPPK